MAIKINDQEIAALRGLPPRQIVLYLLGIRPFMDFATGMVGSKRGVSYQSFAEMIYVDPGPGIKGGSFSKDQIKRGLEALEKKGLISRHSRYKKLIICCTLATWDSCGQKKAALKPPPEAASLALPRKKVKSNSYSKDAAKTATTKMGKAATPPESGNSITLSLGVSTICDHFQPSTAVIEKAKRHECPTATCPDELVKFISFHQSKGTRRCDWNAEFLGWLLKAKQYHQERSYAKQNRSHRTKSRPQKNQSAVDRVFTANQALIGWEGDVIDHHG